MGIQGAKSSAAACVVDNDLAQLRLCELGLTVCAALRVEQHRQVLSLLCRAGLVAPHVQHLILGEVDGCPPSATRLVDVNEAHSKLVNAALDCIGLLRRGGIKLVPGFHLGPDAGAWVGSNLLILHGQSRPQQVVGFAQATRIAIANHDRIAHVGKVSIADGSPEVTRVGKRPPWRQQSVPRRRHVKDDAQDQQSRGEERREVRRDNLCSRSRRAHRAGCSAELVSGRARPAGREGRRDGGEGISSRTTQSRSTATEHGSSAWTGAARPGAAQRARLAPEACSTLSGPPPAARLNHRQKQAQLLTD